MPPWSTVQRSPKPRCKTRCPQSRSNAGYRCTIEAGGTSRIAGAGVGTYDAAFSANLLSILIQDKVIRQELVRLDLPEPSRLDSVAVSEVESATTPATGCPGTGASVLAAFPLSYRLRLVQLQEDEEVLAAHLAGSSLLPSSLATYAAGHEGEASQACVSVIEVTSEPLASSLWRQILHGANFADLAKAHSVDTSSASSGGALGCIPDSDFSVPLNTDIAALKVGHVSRPVAFSFQSSSGTSAEAWLLLLVTRRVPETYAQLVSTLLDREQTALGALIGHLVRSANIEIDPRYGTWDLKQNPPRVQPNPGPSARIVPNPNANAGPAASG